MCYGHLIIIFNTILVVYSWSGFGTFDEPTTPTFRRFKPTRRYMLQGKMINYKADVGRTFENIIKIETSSPCTVKSVSNQRPHERRIRHKNEVINVLRRRTNIFMDEVNTAPPNRQSNKHWLTGPVHTNSADHTSHTFTLLTPYHPTVHGLFTQRTSLSGVASNDVWPPVKISQNANNQKNVMKRRSLPQSFPNNVTAFEIKTSQQNETKISVNDVKHLNTEEVLLKHITSPSYPEAKPSSTIDINTNDTLKNENLVRNITCSRRCKEYYDDEKLCVTKEIKNTSTNNNILTTAASTDNVSPTDSTFHDKIKFFEVYDINTTPLIAGNENVEQEINTKPIYGRQSSPKVNMRQKRIEPERKYNAEEFLAKICAVAKANHIIPDNLPEIFTHSSTLSYHSNDDAMLKNRASQINVLPITKLNQSRTISWAQYPFMAVYVYERFQVHCDAGVISRHWLVAAGSCLSRHRKELTGDVRSAFVISCVDNWWEAQQINYVKYSLIHPQFSQKDPVRRHLFNIGLIKVAASMSSLCKNWAPVRLISHQFKSNNQDSIASAIGWGLDRYHTAYSLSDLPQRPLSIYKGLVFSDTCPGRLAKYRDDEGVSNVYCLSLPPYVVEEEDPTHGGLLMVEGSLVALYLQEERRMSGDQSAQYTGIWRLVPWIMEMASEPYEDHFGYENKKRKR